MIEELKIALKQDFIEDKKFLGIEVLEKLKMLYC
jgi:hypothetical protein